MLPGNRLSPYYANFANGWARVEYMTMTTQRKEIDRGAIGTLTLVPEK